MTDTANLALPCIEGSQAQKHVTHNEALRVLDTLVQLAVLDRDLTAPPGSPAEGQRWIVKTGATGAWASHVNAIAAWQDGVWQFSTPRIGWLAYVVDESVLLAWDGSAWVSAIDALTPTALNNMTLVGVGTTADSTNPLSAKLNNTLFVAKTVAEGGDGNLRYKLSKESAAKTLSFLLQDNYSGRAEIGLTGDDDFHFKVSPDGSAWVDALVLDKTTGAAKFNAGIYLNGVISPAQITANQNDYSPAGLSGAAVLRLSSDASHNITGLAAGANGSLLTLVNVGSNAITLQNANSGSSAANRFAFSGDVTITASQAASIWYDGTSSRWRLVAAASSGGSGNAPADLELVLAEMALAIADAANVGQFLGDGGNRFADSFDALTFVNTGGATNLDSGTAGLLKPAALPGLLSGTSAYKSGFSGTSAASVLDDNSAGTSTTISGWGNQTGQTLSQRVFVSKDLGSSLAVTSVTIKNLSANGANNNISIVYSDDNAAWTLYDSTFNYASGTGDFTKTANVTARYWGIALGAVNNIGVMMSLTDFNVSGNSTLSNVTVTSTALTALTVPVSAKLVARVKEIDSIALNTDVVFSVSRDGGTTYTAFSMTKRFTVNAVSVYESAALSISSQPSGTSMKWKCASANNKNFELQDVYLYWS